MRKRTRRAPWALALLSVLAIAGVGGTLLRVRAPGVPRRRGGANRAHRSDRLVPVVPATLAVAPGDPEEVSPDMQHMARTAEALLTELEELRARGLALEATHARELALVRPEHRASARNLLHYLAVRQQDIRDLQGELAELGLSSLGRLEPHALASLDAVIVALRRLGGRALEPRVEPEPPIGFREGEELVSHRTEQLLGSSPKDRAVRVMVTMPSEAAADPHLVRELLIAGMDVMRINCAHDDAGVWARMIAHLRDAERSVSRPCRVLCDLAGPKLRTGSVEPGPGVLHYWPLRDDAGRILQPARVRIARTAAPAGSEPPTLPVDAELLERLRLRDELRFDDVRGRRRALTIVAKGEDGYLAEADRTAYVGSGTPLALHRAGEKVGAGTAGELPPIEQAIRLVVGDTLVLGPDTELGRPAVLDDAGRVAHPASIGCTLPEVFRDVRVGQRVYFDDGKVGGIVRDLRAGRLTVEITYARSGKAKLRGDRGINLPDTDFHLSALTDKDQRDLDFVVAHADLVGLSFLRRAGDVEALLGELDRRGGAELGIVLKIETRRAFDQLPRLLLAALRSARVGVMVARGDLGVEMGFSRLAEVQEEILWLCEAAHVPVIWATQVLESLAKKGMPSRAEVTDAAMGGSAECVMLNKGPHVVEAVRFLSDVVLRMQGHHQKKRSMLRQLGVSRML